MSPCKINEDRQGRNEMNGPRPAPLKIKRIIQKPHFSGNVTAGGKRWCRSAEQLPTIIYENSPPVIHTKPLDFMAVVQKLTGRSNFEEAAMPEEEERKPVKAEYSESSSVLVDENSGDGGIDIILSSSLGDDYLDEIPLFTPNLSNFFLSSL